MKYDLKKLQQTELSILVDFDKYCKENNLQYYLIGGALLGAVRNEKFIPWDDDIDVCMPREDYERLKKICNFNKYFLQNSDSDPNFARCIQKIRLNSTEIIEKCSQGVQMHNGIYIDIFPIDYLDSADPLNIAKKANIIRKLMSIRAIKSGYVGGRFPLLKKIIKILCPLSYNCIDRNIYKICTKENNSQRNYAILFLHNYSWNKQLHKADVFGKGSICRFEGYDFIAPENPNEFLKKVFGENYIQEPPVERQIQPHNYVSVKYQIKD